MAKIGLLAWITFKDSIRSKVLYGIFFFGLALFTANLVITNMFSFEIGKVAVDVGLSATALSGLIIVFFFSINMMANDLERKTIYLILSKPFSKAQYLLGKFTGLAMIIAISSVTLGACAVLSVKLSIMGSEAFIPLHFSWTTFFLGLIFLTLSLLVVLAISFFCICITNHSFTALLLCLMSYFIGQNIENALNIFSRIKMFASNVAALKLIKILAWVFPNLSAFDLKTTAAYGLPVDAAYLFWTAIYGLSYIGICLMVSIFIFQKRELG